MALGESVKRHFPLKNVEDIVAFFKSHLEKNDDPNLALLSILIGYIENLLTCHRSVNIGDDPDDKPMCFPKVEFGDIEALYTKFTLLIKGSVDLSRYHSGRYATRELVKKVSDVIWSSLTRSSYKDKPHLQSLYNYITGNKLDSFGVALAVVAACQVLKYSDVHLALSEDHAWVTFGAGGKETAEVTWHGKGNEDRRGQSIPNDKSWLYLNGHCIHLKRHTEAAALVIAINPSVSLTVESAEMKSLQQQLLWVLYDMGHLKNYPMALSSLGDLEEIIPTPGRPPPVELYHESVLSAKGYYNNHHVYPYTFLGGFMYRNKRYKEALEAWTNAADVIRNYNYGREDEEIYKEFQEVAELISHIVKINSSLGNDNELGRVPFLQDPQCFAYLLRFYDGLCAWEEGSATPVLHIGWAKPFVASITKFPPNIRAAVNIKVLDSEDGAKKESTEEPQENGDEKSATETKPPSRKKNKKNQVSKDAVKLEGKEDEFLKTMENQFGCTETPHPNIVALAAACGENILNPEYLLGSGEPFSSSRSSDSPASDCQDLLSSHSNGTPFPGLNVDALLKSEGDGLENNTAPPPEKCFVTLSSQKMAGLRELLLTEKLNTSAIQLQLTAQSQVQVIKRGGAANLVEFVSSGRPTKRSRRE